MPQILDAYGRPVEVDVLTQELAAATITGVRSPWHASTANGLTPERLGQILAAVDTMSDATEYLTLAEEMEERDLHYASVIHTRKLAVAKLGVTVEAVSDDAEDKAIAEFCGEQMKRKAVRGLLKALMDAAGKGVSVVEIMWNKAAMIGGQARWVPSRYEWRDPRYFLFDRLTGQKLRLRDEKDLAQGVELPPYKFIEHRPGIKQGLPIRGGLARLVAVAFMCKGYSMKDWLAFAEVFGMPIRVGKHGEQATPEQKSRLLQAVASIGTDAACIIPNSMVIEFVKADTSSGGDKVFQGLANWLDSQVSKAVLGQTMTTDDGSSRSQAEVHDAVRGDIRDDDAEQLAATIERDLIKPMVDLNFGPREDESQYPRACIRYEEPEDLKLMSESLPPFIDRGLPVEVTTILDMFGLPTPEGVEDGALLAAKAPPPAPGQQVDENGDPVEPDEPKPKPGAKKPKAEDDKKKPKPKAKMRTALTRETRDDLLDRVMRGERLTKDQRALLSALERDGMDRLVAGELDAGALALETALAPLLELARTAKNAHEFAAGLANLKTALDFGPVVESLALATFKARALGDVKDRP